jgi:hypothetical protein
VVIWYDTNILEDHAASNFRAKTEAAWSSETLFFHITTWHNPEDCNLNVHCESLRSYMEIELIKIYNFYLNHFSLW